MKTKLWTDPAPLTQGQIFGGFAMLLATQLITPRLAAMLVALLGIGGSPDSTAFRLWHNIFYFAINLCGTVVVLRGYLLQQLARLRACWYRSLTVGALGFLAYYLCSLLLGILIGHIQPNFDNANDRTLATLAEQGYGLVFLGTVVLVPLTEELLYRALLFGALHRCPRPVSFLASILLFSAIHLLPYLGPGGYDALSLALAFLQYALPATILCLCYGMGGSLLAPLLVHTLVNLFGMLEMR